MSRSSTPNVVASSVSLTTDAPISCMLRYPFAALVVIAAILLALAPELMLAAIGWLVCPQLLAAAYTQGIALVGLFHIPGQGPCN